MILNHTLIHHHGQQQRQQASFGKQMILQEVLTILSKKIACTRSTTVAIFLNHFILKAEKRDSISKLTNGISTEVLNCELKVSKPATRSKTEVSEVLQVLTGQSTTTTM